MKKAVITGAGGFIGRNLTKRLLQENVQVFGIDIEAVQGRILADAGVTPLSVDIGDKKELDVLGSHLSPYCYPFVIKNIANGTLKTDGVVTRTFPLEEWETAFDYASGKYGDFKVAITF